MAILILGGAGCIGSHMVYERMKSRPGALETPASAWNRHKHPLGYKN